MYKSLLIDGFLFLKTISFRKIINGFLLRVSYLFSRISGKYMHWGQPESLSIEPTNLCNLKCPECPSGNNNLTRPRLFLSLEKFKTLIDENYQTLSYLQLFFQGEPFLHPKLFELLSYVTAKKIYTVTSTNGLFLTVGNCEKLINSGLQRIIISVDGTTHETYEKYRVGGNLDTVLSGIENLSAARRTLKSQTPFIILQFVVFKTNEHQIDDIKKLSKKLGIDKLNIKSAQIDNFEKGNPMIPENEKYSRYRKQSDGNYLLNRNPKFKCKRIWNGSVVSADLKLLPCCFDKNGNYTYADLIDESVQSSWKSTTAKLFRKKVWENFNGFKICRNCTEGLK